MNISEQKLRKIIRNEIKNSLNEGMFDNMFSFMGPPKQLLSDELIQKHVDNFHTARFIFHGKHKTIPFNSYDAVKAVDLFTNDLKSAELGSAPPIITKHGMASVWKDLISFKDTRLLREIIMQKFGGNVKEAIDAAVAAENVHPSYERYVSLALPYMKESF